MILYAHRGLDLERIEKYSENSLDSFQWSAQKGFGVTFEVQMSADEELIVSHDATAEKWTKGRNGTMWNKLDRAQIFALENQHGPLCRLNQVLELAYEFPQLQLAIYLQGQCQTPSIVKKLIEALNLNVTLHPRLVVSALKPEVATLFRRSLPGVGLAALVAHDFDISRFQKLKHGTLLSVDSALLKKNIYDWVWLDEWDRQGRKNSSKSFYTRELIDSFRRNGMKTVLLSPELHKAEKHQDATANESLQKRWRELLQMKPDAICTEHPRRVEAIGLPS